MIFLLYADTARIFSYGGFDATTFATFLFIYKLHDGTGRRLDTFCHRAIAPPAGDFGVASSIAAIGATFPQFRGVRCYHL